MIDIAVAYPCEGSIQLQSRFLFSDPETEACQLFLQRLTLVEQVREVAVQSALQVADIFYCPDRTTRHATLNAIRNCLSAPNGVNHVKHGSGPTVNGRQPVRWRANSRGELRLYRHGSVISTWEV